MSNLEPTPGPGDFDKSAGALLRVSEQRPSLGDVILILLVSYAGFMFGASAGLIAGAIL